MKCMGKVVLDISMSLDGFIAGLHDSPDNPMGDDGLRLHRWLGWMKIITARVSRLSHPSVAAATSPMAEALEKQSTARSGSRYSWRKPFLRRPPVTPVGSAEAGAKK